MKVLPVLVLALVLAGCKAGPDERDAIAGADTLTRHQRDSVIGASRLPGAKAVQRASAVEDAAAARAQQLERADSTSD